MVAASTPTAASTVADAATSPKAAAELVDSAVRLEPLVHVGGWGDRRRRAVRAVLDARSVGRFTRSVAWTLKLGVILLGCTVLWGVQPHVVT